MLLQKFTRRQALAVVTGAPIAVAASNKNNRANNPTPAGILFSDPQIKPSSTTGQQQAGAYLLFFLTGTLTPANVYADGLLTTPLSQTPGSSQFSCTADSAGRFNPIYLDPAVIYRVQFFNSVGVKLDDTDPYISGGLASISAETIGKFIYPKTAAEISLSVTPTNFQYPADPCIDPRRYGADPTGVSDSTTAVQTALNVAYTANGCVSIGNACNFLVGPLSVTITGAANRGIRILGSSLVGSALTAKSSICGALLTFTTSNPATTLVESFVILEHFSVYSGAPVMGQHGISIQGVGSWQLSNVRVSGFDHGLSVVSSLVGIVNDGSQFLDNNTGVSISLSGSTNTTNLIRIQDCRINLNALWGIDYNGGSELQLRGNDIEANGTSQTITFATSPAGGGSTTMPNLSAVWAHETHIYAINLSTGQVVYCLLTNGSAAVGAANVGATGSPTTAATTGYGGGVVIRAGISPDLEEGNVRFDSNWLEANNGHGIYIEAPSVGLNNFEIRGGQIISTQNGAAINCQGTNFLSVSDVTCASAADTFYFTSGVNLLLLKNAAAQILLDSSVYPTYINVQTGAGYQRAGRATSATLTLTGCTTRPNVNATFIQQGDRITCYIPDFTATSNANACTITGIPAALAPSLTHFFSLVVEDIGVDNNQIGVIAGDGTTLTLYKDGSQTGFTTSGSKGVRGQELTWHL